jgi:hypothetical protein
VAPVVLAAYRFDHRSIIDRSPAQRLVHRSITRTRRPAAADVNDTVWSGHGGPVCYACYVQLEGSRLGHGDLHPFDSLQNR